MMAAVCIGFVGCDDDDPVVLPTETFTLTIENVQTGKGYLQSGTTGFLAPGDSESVSFNAGIGSSLSLATMYVQSNDLFYAFDQEGLSLYDGNGAAVTGDVTGSINLWDAGTEVNEEPGVGGNQPPRQTGPNTGGDENGNVELVSDVNDGFTYPSDETVIKVSLAHDGGTMFTLTIENISGGSTLPSPLAPGVWGVHGASAMLFTQGAAAPTGLEGLAEDGANQDIVDAVAANTGYASPFAPGVLVVHSAGANPIFDMNTDDRGQGLEALAEDGDPSGLSASAAMLDGVRSVSVFNTPEGETAPGPLMGGATYSVTFEAEEGDYISFATMLIHTNDLFFSPGEGGIALFSNGAGITANITDNLSLWDAGTEVNEFPGAGNNQPARGGGNSGPAENGKVRVVDDGFSYPNVGQMIRVMVAKN
jgi:hypothetical protein